VNCVDWDQAVDFCQWVGGRLPSEAEWEYAARSGGQDITYPWGNDSPTCSLANCHIFYIGCEGSTASSCSRTAGNTTQGLCDMAGNVSEWVQDWFHYSYDCDANPAYCPSGGRAPTDGSAWESPIGTERAIRGGCWSNNATWLSTFNRFSYPPSIWTAEVGLRCAR
jgi:formylglycine-generating enzyme required for sulfatase activity